MLFPYELISIISSSDALNCLYHLSVSSSSHIEDSQTKPLELEQFQFAFHLILIRRHTQALARQEKSSTSSGDIVRFSVTFTTGGRRASIRVQLTMSNPIFGVYSIMAVFGYWGRQSGCRRAAEGLSRSRRMRPVCSFCACCWLD